MRNARWMSSGTPRIWTVLLTLSDYTHIASNTSNMHVRVLSEFNVTLRNNPTFAAAPTSPDALGYRARRCEGDYYAAAPTMGRTRARQVPPGLHNPPS